MTQTSFPFEGIDTTETQFSKWARHFNNGVNDEPTGDALEVSAGTGLAVDVEAGEAMVRGHYYISDATESLALATADATNDRLDLVVLRLDPTANSIVLAVKTGTPAGSPSAPALVQTDAGIFEQALAEVLVPANSGVPTTITDRREFMGTRLGSWSTAGRPTPAGRVLFGFNTTDQAIEFYNPITDAWGPVAPEINTLNDIGDVTITSATTGQILEWSGTAWINGQADTAGIADDAVTTAKILDANVTRAKLASGLAAFTARSTITATNASWPVPSLGSPIVKVTVMGGGGGGGGGAWGGYSGNVGGTGGTTTFNAGGAGSVSASGGTGGRGGNTGQAGQAGTAGNASGNGAQAGMGESNGGAGSEGNGGARTVAYLDLTGISTVNVTIGAGGTSGATSAGPGANRAGGVGGRGEVIVEYVAA